MRYLIILTLLFVSLVHIPPGDAQTPDGADQPRYIQCGAEDYLVERWHIFQIVTTAYDAIWDASDNATRQNAAIGDYHMKDIQARELLLAIDADDLPECVQEVHRLTLQYHFAFNDFLFFALAGSASYQQRFSVQAGRYQLMAEELDNQLFNHMLELEWLDEEGYLTKPIPPRPDHIPPPDGD